MTGAVLRAMLNASEAVAAANNETRTPSQARQTLLAQAAALNSTLARLRGLDTPAPWVKFQNRFDRAVVGYTTAIESSAQCLTTRISCALPRTQMTSATLLFDEAMFHAKQVAPQGPWVAVGTSPRACGSYESCALVSLRNNQASDENVVIRVRPEGTDPGVAFHEGSLAAGITWSAFGRAVPCAQGASTTNLSIYFGRSSDGDSRFDQSFYRYADVPCAADPLVVSHVAIGASRAVTQQQLARTCVGLGSYLSCEVAEPS